MQSSDQLLQQVELTANGLRFKCRKQGSKGEPVIMLHGFPETSHMWLPLMAKLSSTGYQCLAPDQRGYSPGARPEGIEHYRYAHLSDDVIAMADEMGYDKFHLIGHDHGAGVGWTVTNNHPDRVHSWTAMSVPHIAAFGRAIREDKDQSERSQYIGVFQQVGEAEKMLSADNLAPLKAIWDKGSKEQVEEYVNVFSQPGALTGALNWYRGSLSLEQDAADATQAVGEISTPTLCLWGNQDTAIGRQSTVWAAEYMTGPYRFVEMDAGHWLMQEAKDQVIAEILNHLQANPLG
ncbi:MAG: alpha/beta hydrolase [Gammaproteobacteria bacterium]|nr:alpha/beta hydrolase [Gammaproteobacteria bacterium]